jgi:hypothetical protein
MAIATRTERKVMTMSAATHDSPLPADTSYTDQEVYNEVGQPVIFKGKLIASVTTETSAKSRWTELYIYLSVGGSYVYYRVGRTVVFHSVSPNGCKRGTAVPKNTYDLDYMDPCTRCNPSTSDEVISMENDINTLSVHDSPRDLIETMLTLGTVSASSQTQPRMSGPALDLLNAAALKDAQIKSAMNTTITIV